MTEPDRVRGPGAADRTAGSWPPAPAQRPSRSRAGNETVGLVDLLDRVVHRGVVVTGDVVISLADVDLLLLDLRLLLTGVHSALAAAPARPVEEA
ncbi:gas vesicle protein GvpJ [Geodermatophilus ruber]|uniref:Gas vesicle protein n=1 Tax=Geodermatophilus ruber TaxID=504800 RepID=A0A1I4GQ39_9ACTN|nr:gas vesicle protein GvpJ [Geodermatophilus ruber]SFL32138.1 Gas vesicle protein [Geodermatophilus ruber]